MIPAVYSGSNYPFVDKRWWFSSVWYAFCYDSGIISYNPNWSQLLQSDNMRDYEVEAKKLAYLRFCRISCILSFSLYPFFIGSLLVSFRCCDWLQIGNSNPTSGANDIDGNDIILNLPNFQMKDKKIRKLLKKGITELYRREYKALTLAEHCISQ